VTPAASIPPANDSWAPPQPQPLTRSDWLALLGVFTAAAMVRLAYFLSVRQQVWFQHPLMDAYVYHLWAQRIAAGDWLGTGVFNQSPLYPYLLGLIYRLAGARPAFVEGLQLLLGAVSCGLVFLLGRRLFSRGIGLAAGLMSAAYGISFFLEGSLLTAALIQALNLGILLTALWASGRTRWQAWFLPGVLLGLSLLARPNIALFGLLLAFWAWKLRPRTPSSGARLKPVAALALGAVLMVLPVTLRNAWVLRDFIVTVPTGALNFYLGNVPGSSTQVIDPGDFALSAFNFADDFKRSAEQHLKHKLSYSASNRYWFGRAWRTILAHPGAWMATLLNKTVRLFNYFENTSNLNFYLVRQRTAFLRLPWLGYALVLPWAVLGMWWNRRRGRGLFPVYALVAAVAFSNIFLFSTTEYRYALLPAFFLFACAGLAEWLRLLRSRRWSRAVVGAAIVLVALFLAAGEFNPPSKKAYLLALARTNFASMLERIGDRPGAIREYRQARELLAADQDLNLLAEVTVREMDALSRERRDAAALAVMQEVLPKFLRRPALLDKFAHSLADLGFLELAALALERAAAQAPDQPRYWMHLGAVYAKLRDVAGSRRAFEQARRLDPALDAQISKTLRAVERDAAQGARGTGRSEQAPVRDGAR